MKHTVPLTVLRSFPWARIASASALVLFAACSGETDDGAGDSTSVGGSPGTDDPGSGSQSSGDPGSGSEGAGDGSGSGGLGSGGTNTDGSGGGGSELAEQYPCDGTTDGYDAVVTGSGSNWTVTTGGSQSYGSMYDAISAAFAGSSGSSSDKGKVLVQGSGDIPAAVQLQIPSYTVFNVCGTINVTPPVSGSDRSPCYARGRTDIDIPHITITGSPQYGCFFRETNNVHMGIVDIRLDAGLGIRADNNPSAPNSTWENSIRNDRRNHGFRLDDVYVSGTSQGVEFYGIEDITIGSLVARNTSEAGLMLNNSRFVEVGLVDGEGVSPNAGYAVFRMANDHGRNWDDDTHPLTTHVGKVIARSSGGNDGRGIFCLTGSGGVTIDEIDLENTSNHSIYLQDCTNVVIGNPTSQSRIHDSANILLRPPSANISFENLTITDTTLTIDQGCPTNLQWTNVTLDGMAVTACE